MTRIPTFDSRQRNDKAFQNTKIEQKLYYRSHSLKKKLYKVLWVQGPLSVKKQNAKKFTSQIKNNEEEEEEGYDQHRGTCFIGLV